MWSTLFSSVTRLIPTISRYAPAAARAVTKYGKPVLAGAGALGAAIGGASYLLGHNIGQSARTYLGKRFDTAHDYSTQQSPSTTYQRETRNTYINQGYIKPNPIRSYGTPDYNTDLGYYTGAQYRDQGRIDAQQDYGRTRAYQQEYSMGELNTADSYNQQESRRSIYGEPNSKTRELRFLQDKLYNAQERRNRDTTTAGHAAVTQQLTNKQLQDEASRKRIREYINSQGLVDTPGGSYWLDEDIYGF